ncbi:MAG TPA: two-component regulator propeller domain-containing protein [Blastocatellia bacterium]|nr:two-component regulator propeller domain-containing protein [Blastocatellia bacterium]
MKLSVSKTAFCFLLLSAVVSSDSSEKPLSQYIHDAWQTDQGLPQNTVFAVTQTPDGYIWLATQEGLVRFDGIRFTVFDKRNTPQMKDNNIQTLYLDRAGQLWAGTEGGGLVRLKDGVFTAYTTEDGLADNIVDAIYEDRAGNLWVGTLGGLSRFKDGKFTTFTARDGLPSDAVLSICEDRAGNLWIGTEDDGLSRLKDGEFVSYTTKDGLSNNLVRALHEDREGNLWIGTRAGLCRFKDGKFTSFFAKDGLVDDSVLSIYEDREGSLWIGTRGGLARRKDGRFSAYTTKEGLSENSVASIYEDKEGNLWIGTYEGGLNRLKEGSFTAYTRKDGLADDIVRPIYQDSKGVLWIGTASGLSRSSDGKIINYTAKDGLADNNVLALREDRAGALWIGTGGGLNKLTGGRMASYTTEKGLSDNTVLSLCESRDGSLWIGTASGLNRLKDEKITAYTTRDGLTNDSIWSLYEDGEGTLFIGTDGGGLNRFKDDRFTALTTKDGLANDIVLSLYADREGALWIGTNGGLSRLKDGRVVSYTTAAGLFDDVVFQILEDAKDNLWMSCNKGVFRVSKQELEDFAQGGLRAINSVSYGTADGMKSRECNGGFQPAGWKTRDGKLWFPTIKGAAVIDPESIKINQLAPPVLIEQVLADHEPIDTAQGAQLAPGKSKFEFHYTGLSFIAPEKVRFKYKLEGFDTDWIDAGTRREVAYTNIPPGSYRFRVMACNNDRVWNEAGAAFSFYLKPRFYQTYWFYGLCAAAVGMLGLGFYRLRVRQMQSRFSAVLEERNRIAREIHDTLAQGFAGISLQLEAVDETLIDSPETARNHLNRARTLVRSSLAEARRSVWELRSQALEKTDLAGALSAFAQQLTAGAADVKVSGARRRLSSLVETNLLHIGRESLTNAVKHAQAAAIQMELSFDHQSVRLSVKDNGCGFDANGSGSRVGGGFGLISMRERAEQIGAQLNIESSPGKGTKIVVEVLS